MKITDYLHQCLKKDDFSTKAHLDITEAALLTRFSDLRERSESTGLEHGFILKSLGTGLDAGPTIVGTSGTAVDLKTKDVKLESNYIGDCHSHPYLLKMGEGVQIGPSTSDYEEWWNHRPNAFDVAIHFVISGAGVFLVFMRKKTARRLNFDDATSDTEKMNSLVQNDATFNMAMIAAMEKRAKDYKGGLLEEQAAWAKFAPKAAKQFMKDNRKMNIQLANSLHFEYYYGDMDKDPKKASCRLSLLSVKVYK